MVVLSNSILIASMIDQEALNASSLSWMADAVRRYRRRKELLGDWSNTPE
jgi:hypothetical protein